MNKPKPWESAINPTRRELAALKLVKCTAVTRNHGQTTVCGKPLLHVGWHRGQR